MDIKNSLTQLGLSEKEAIVYLTSLSLKEATVLQVAKKSGIKRSTVYVVLNELSQKGLVSKILKNKKTFFVADNPRKLLSDTELKLEMLKQTVPFIENLMAEEDNKPQVKIFEIKGNLDLAYDESFQENTEVLFMSTIKYSLELFPKTINKLKFTDRVKNFSTRELVDKNAEGQKYKEENQSQNRKIKFMASKFLPFEVDIGIFGNTVLITSVKQEYFTISLKSKEIAQAFKSLFEAMWLLAEE